MKQVRVLVVDDSALMRKLIPQMLAADESIDVVGTAMDGSFCLKKIEELKPNVVTLDLEMPGMNGIDTLKEIMRRQPVPVIVFSSHSTEGASVTMKALGLGAFDFVTKPKDASAHMAETARELIAKVKAAAECKLKPRVLAGSQPKPEKAPAPTGAPNKIVAIDPNTFLQSEAAALATSEGLGDRIEFRPGNAEALPFPDATFGCVFSVTVFEV